MIANDRSGQPRRTIVRRAVRRIAEAGAAAAAMAARPISRIVSGSQSVAVVNESSARSWLGDRSPAGARAATTPGARLSTSMVRANRPIPPPV